MVLLNQRAAEAERLVLSRFVGSYRQVPGTRLGRAAAPTDEVVTARFAIHGRDPLNYWWQAHLIDAIVDGGWRRIRTGDAAGARRSATLGHRVLATVWLGNGVTLRNHFYDDMAWLALAVDRLAALEQHLWLTWRHASLVPARRTLLRQLLQARDGSGGVVWSKDRDFLNVPAAGPVALHLARTGHTRKARTILEWILRELGDTTRGLVLDGVRRDGTVVRDIYTYNQGTTLAALLELGEPHDLERAADLVHAVEDHLTEACGRPAGLVTHGGGDGGLFTGILVRYLAMAAEHSGLDSEARHVAAGLVSATSDALWAGRDPVTGLFPTSDTGGGVAYEGGHRVELSTQLQAWMVVEAAALLDTC